jgi:hypothetical protein
MMQTAFGTEGFISGGGSSGSKQEIVISKFTTQNLKLA